MMMNDSNPLPYQPAVTGSPQRRSLAEELEGLLIHADGKPLTVSEAVDALGERGWGLILIVITIPFLFPIPTMGLSAPAGFAIAAFGLSVALQRKPWLPGFIRRRQISFATLSRIVASGTKWSHRVEKLLKPRLKFMLWPMVNVPIGISLIFSGIFLSLPLPIPFTNAVPAVAILLLLLGLLERDGVFVIAGQVVSVAIFAVCVVIAYLMIEYGYHGAKEIVESWMFGKEPAATSAPTSAPTTAATQGM